MTPGHGKLSSRLYRLDVWTVDAVASFVAAMDDDLATPAALDVVFRLVRSANTALDEARRSDAERASRTALGLLAVLGIEVGGGDGDSVNGERLSDAEVEALLALRSEARGCSGFPLQQIRFRDDLAAAGVVVSDSAYRRDMASRMSHR